jgi:large subunit ribosomal protein L13
VNTTQKTFSAKPSNIDKNWLTVDAEGKTLGRLASSVAAILRGKTKPSFTPHMDMGDNVIVINAEKVVLTGKKLTDKKYFSYSGYPGSEKFISVADKMVKDPTFPVMNAVKGMLPKTKLGRKQLTNLRVYAGNEHGHSAQKPENLEI